MGERSKIAERFVDTVWRDWEKYTENPSEKNLVIFYEKIKDRVPKEIQRMKPRKSCN